MGAAIGALAGLVSGAADAYARMARKPATTLLHLGPGLANALANLHNAKRARSPVVNLVGDMATWHADSDAPLCSNISDLASWASVWVCTATLDSVASDAHDAVRAVTAPEDTMGSRVGAMSRRKMSHRS